MIQNYADHANNERTFLSWVRTATAIVGFGLAAARIGNPGVALWSEVALLITGAVVVSVAFVRMWWLRNRISAEEDLDDGAVSADAFLFILVAALCAMLAMFAFHVHQS